jgi:uncharacterized protein YdhG (YjbR/CyaY superfamily)
MQSIKFKTVSAYISAQPTDIQALLNELRNAIKQAAPQAEETISYNMPFYKYHGRLVYFAAFARHIGFYPLPSAIKAFKKEIAGYKTATGTIQFPIDKGIPKTLVKKIVKYRVKGNLAKATTKKIK